ncbi:DUF5987 family protein [Actinocorallia sp. A-T 12471]|uniref:DUF5987 family protein n=1 Tax=Actinocorallia sp. A-T 12471 TaxID=3089813 RepID=UPI0029D16CEA|nr:DUF5987 family protein [Actinocorallia sp. A-T 12471]MDX6741617.1 DUF5987 family protein [Actinocorallia sp. A-T 12471]
MAALDLGSEQVETLEAFADTILPGARRGPDDRAVAGVAEGGGAVAAGALELLSWDATGVTGWLPGLADTLNDHARAYAAEHGLAEGRPAFVGLAYADRRALVGRLTTPDHPEKAFWVSLALFCNMAFDSAAHLNTAAALAAGHPGLVAMGIAPPDADGRWRFPDFGYGRELARLHPSTTASGSPE